MEFNSNIHINETIEEHRLWNQGLITSLTIHITAYKRNNLIKVEGDGNLLGHSKQTWKIPTTAGKYYTNYNSSPVELTKTFTYLIPESDQTDKIQPSTNTMDIDDWHVYRDKKRIWRNSYRTEEYYNCYRDFWDELESLNVSW